MDDDHEPRQSSWRVRTARASDVGEICRIYAPIVLQTAISFETVPPTHRDMSARLEQGLRQFPWLVAENTHGQVVGYAYASSHRSRPAYRWCAETSVYVHEEGRGQGVGFALYERLLAVLDEIGYVNVYGAIAVPNAPSVALHKALGFTRIGVFPRIGFKLGRWHDVEWWAKRLRQNPTNVNEPRPFGTVESTSIVLSRTAKRR